VLAPTLASRARSCVVHPSAARAIRHWKGFIWWFYYRTQLTSNRL
jgi:hypothetical protein